MPFEDILFDAASAREPEVKGTEVRFLHTADWQLGHWPGQIRDEERAKTLYDARFEAVRRLARLAHEHGVDFVLVAGDVFDDAAVDHEVMERLVALLGAFAPIPVYLIPGNHDPVAAHLYQDRRFREARPENVQVFLEPGVHRIHPAVALAVAPVLQKQHTRPPLKAFRPEDFPADAPYRIALAHGTLRELVDPTQLLELPISVEEAEALGLHYLALGHFHGWRQLGVAVYPGTPEATGFDEREPGFAALVALRNPETAPEVQRVQVGRFSWRTEELRAPDTRLLIQKLEELQDDDALNDTTLLRLNLVVDEHDPSLEPRLRSLRRTLQDRVFYLDWRWTAQRRSLPPDFQSRVAREFPEGRELLNTLEQLLDRLRTPDPLGLASPVSLERPAIQGLSRLPDEEVLAEARRVLEQILLDLLEETP